MPHAHAASKQEGLFRKEIKSQIFRGHDFPSVDTNKTSAKAFPCIASSEIPFRIAMNCPSPIGSWQRAHTSRRALRADLEVTSFQGRVLQRKLAASVQSFAEHHCIKSVRRRNESVMPRHPTLKHTSPSHDYSRDHLDSPIFS